jgi:hypothetical protein
MLWIDDAAPCTERTGTGSLTSPQPGGDASPPTGKCLAGVRMAHTRAFCGDIRADIRAANIRRRYRRWNPALTPALATASSVAALQRRTQPVSAQRPDGKVRAITRQPPSGLHRCGNVGAYPIARTSLLTSAPGHAGIVASAETPCKAVYDRRHAAHIQSVLRHANTNRLPCR